MTIRRVRVCLSHSVMCAHAQPVRKCTPTMTSNGSRRCRSGTRARISLGRGCIKAKVSHLRACSRLWNDVAPLMGHAVSGTTVRSASGLPYLQWGMEGGSDWDAASSWIEGGFARVLETVLLGKDELHERWRSRAAHPLQQPSRLGQLGED